MTTPNGIDIDAVVRAVMAELARRNGKPRHEENGRVFAGKLLGQREVEVLDGVVKEIHVRPGTVVTPLARDLLKRRGITLGFATTTQTKGTGEWAFAIEAPGGGKAEVIRRTLLDAWAEVAADAAAHWVVDRPERGALMLTPEASVATWRANRIKGVRAAMACDVDAVARAVRYLGVNMLVVEPAMLSIPSVKAMAEAFRRGGAPALPEDLS
jgi:hypothetical protein